MMGRFCRKKDFSTERWALQFAHNHPSSNLSGSKKFDRQSSKVFTVIDSSMLMEWSLMLEEELKHVRQQSWLINELQKQEVTVCWMSVLESLARVFRILRRKWCASCWQSLLNSSNKGVATNAFLNSSIDSGSPAACIILNKCERRTEMLGELVSGSMEDGSDPQKRSLVQFMPCRSWSTTFM